MGQSNNSLYTFSFKLVLFICIFLLIAFVFFIPYVSDLGEEKKYTFALHELNENNEPCDIAFFGNSYSFTAYDPSIIKNELGLNAWHINSSAQRLFTSLLVANEMIKTVSLKYIVFDVSDQTVLAPKEDEESIWHYQTLGLQEVPFSFKKMTYLFDFFPVDTYTEYYFTALSKKSGRFFRFNKRSSYLKREDNFNFKSVGPATLFSYNGFSGKQDISITEESFNTEIKRNKKKRESEEVLWSNSGKKQLLNEVISMSKQKGIEILLVNSLKLHRQAFKDTYIDSIVKNNDNVKFLNLNDERQKYLLNESDFYNSTHLNYSGGYKVTQRLIDSLSSFYNLKKEKKSGWDFKYFKLVDHFYNLSDNQDKFIRLEFDKIPDFLDDYQLVISLYPNDNDLLSDHSKAKKFGSDNFYINNISKNHLDIDKSKICILRLDTKITEDDLKKMTLYFYKSNDTLEMRTYNILKNNFE